MRLAIVGIRGIPNNYGGFETLAEYLVQYLSTEVSITVYCSSKDIKTKFKSYKGASLQYIPISSHGVNGIVYDSIALLKALKSADKILLLGFGAGYVMPFLSKKSKKKIAVNIGGLDWKRSKWSSFAQKIIRLSEKLLIKNANIIIADNILIQNYISDMYKRESAFIAYGGDQSVKQPIDNADIYEYSFLNHKYAFTVARIQSDNNIDMILDGFINQTELPIVIVGNWNASQYGKKTRERYSAYKAIYLLDAIYDQRQLDLLRSNCAIYIHGHSAGGTNPSLVEAMYLGLPVFAFASGYNEYTTANEAIYFKNSRELTTLVQNYASLDILSIGEKLKKIAEDAYKWSDVSEKYKAIFFNE